MTDRIYSRVAENCSEFFPKLNAFKSCPEASSEPSCLNCRNFVDSKCTKRMFDEVASRIY